MASRSTASARVALACLAAIVAVQFYGAATRPIGTGEAYLHDRFVRPTARQVWASELPDREVLYSVMEKRSVGLFHVSPCSVRLPALVFGIFYLWAIWRLARVLLAENWWFAAAVVVCGAMPLRWDLFTRAEGTGVALALYMGAVCLAVERKHFNWIGILLGLTIAANLTFSIPSAILALAMLGVQRRWTEWCDRVLIPGSVVALIFLALPLSHAHVSPENRPELMSAQAAHLQTALQALRASAGSNRIRIATIPAAEPVVNFYRAQHRAGNWERAESTSSSEHFDYYLVSASDAGLADERHLIVVYRDADFLLARPGID